MEPFFYLLKGHDYIPIYLGTQDELCFASVIHLLWRLDIHGQECGSFTFNKHKKYRFSPSIVNKSSILARKDGSSTNLLLIGFGIVARNKNFISMNAS